MIDTADVPSPDRARGSRRWIWVLGIVLGLLVGVIGVLYLGRIKAVYQLYWGSNQLRSLFYEDAGLSDAWSSFIGVVGSFFFAFAWVPLSLWSWRLLAWRFSFRQAAISLVCWVVIYGTVPLVHALLGSDVCFNQRNGEPLKWYVEELSGKIMLFDSDGYDTARATQKLPVTPAICSAFARQKINGRPNQITTDIHGIEFFDPNSGKPRVWYYKAADGSFILFDASGFNPKTGERLNPVTPEIVGDMMIRSLKEQQDRAAREAQALKDAEAARQAEAEKLRTERDAAAKAEADRLRAEQEATTKAAAEKRAKIERDTAAIAEADKLRAAQEAAAKAAAERKARNERDAAQKEEFDRRVRVEREAIEARRRDEQALEASRAWALKKAQAAAEAERLKAPCGGLNPRYWVEVNPTTGMCEEWKEWPNMFYHCNLERRVTRTVVCPSR
jgi:hypothetical protein